MKPLYRVVDEMLVTRAIDASHESIRHRAEKFRQKFTDRIRRATQSAMANDYTGLPY